MRHLLLFFLLFAGAARAAPFDPFAETGIAFTPGAAIPMDGRFLDEGGRPVTLAGLAAGRPLLLAPILHACPNICGVTLQGIAQAVSAQRLRPGRDFVLVAFGIDPKEQPAQAAASLRELQKAFPSLFADGGVRGLTGDGRAIRSVTDALGYRYAYSPAIGQYAHLAAMAAITPDGRLSAWLYGLAPDPRDVRLAVTQAGEGRAGTLADKLLLLCYRYDPVTGRYGPLVWTMLRVGGSGTAVALGAFILVALRRDRRARREAAR